MVFNNKTLIISTVLAIAASTALALAETSMNHGQATHNDHGKAMDMTQHTMAGHGESSQTNDLTLPADITLPKGQPLQTLPLLKNEATDSNVFVLTLIAGESDVPLIANHAATKLWLYNGTLLPVIDMKVGDEFIVNIVNHLSQDTTIHWHGINVPADQDGNPHDPIKPGKSQPYQFKITQDMVGSHWFHPHTHNLVAEQVYRGLAGIFIIRDPNDPLKAIPEQNLFFSDLKLDTNGQIAPNSMLDEMNGREGQFALVNGGWQPVINLEGTQRWRLWNGNSARYLNLNFPKDQVEVYLVGNDGGLLEKPVPLQTLLLSPGERSEVVLTPKKEGQFQLIAKKYDRHKMGNVPPEQDLLLATVNMKVGKNIALPKQLRTIDDFGKPVVTRELVYTEDKQMNFLINGQKFDMDRIDIKSKVNQVEAWRIFNNSHMDHNFHLHGHHFLVKEYKLGDKLTKPSYKLLKDTINLKPYERITILVKQDQAGTRMYHCHILEHENAGMMGQVEVAQ